MHEKARGPDGLGITVVARELGITPTTAYKRVKPSGKRRPLRFTAAAVKKAQPQPIGPGNVTLRDVVDRIPGPTRNYGGSSNNSDKMIYVKSVLRRLGIEPYWREGLERSKRRVMRPLLCIREERVPEILALAANRSTAKPLANLIGNMAPPDATYSSVPELSRHYQLNRSTIWARLRKLPAEASRTIPNTSGNKLARPDVWEFRVDAAHAALRGEHWPATSNGRPQATPGGSGQLPHSEQSEDLSAFDLVSKLWPHRKEFKRASDVTKFLARTPNQPAPTGIRNFAKGRRRYVHAGDWLRYFTMKDRRDSELLDDEWVQDQLAALEDRKAAERAHKKPR